MNKRCVLCNRNFKTEETRQKFCNIKCRNRYHNYWNRKKNKTIYPDRIKLKRKIKKLVREKKIFYLSGSKLFSQLNGYGFNNKMRYHNNKVEYTGALISKVLKDLENEKFIKLYSHNDSGYKMYQANK